MAIETLPFGELFAVPPRNGLTRPKAIRGSGTKMVNMGELFACPRISNISMDRVPLNDNEAQRFLLEPGDLLFARQSLVLEGAGKCSVFLADDEPVTFESHITRVRLDREKANSLYYYYYLQSHHGRSAIRSIVEQGAGASGIRGRDLTTLQVGWQPLNIQNRVAQILATFDDKIELNRRMSATLEEMARAIFKSWFVDFDPVHAKAAGRPTGLPPEIDALFPDSFQDSELGSVPKGWEVGSLAEICALSRETIKPFEEPDRVFAHYSIPAHDTGKQPRFEIGQKIKSAKNAIIPGCVLVSKLNPDTERVWIPGNEAECSSIASSEFLVLLPKTQITTEYLYLLMVSGPIRRQLQGMVTGTSKSHQRVQPNSMMNLLVVLPPIHLLSSIAPLIHGNLNQARHLNRQNWSLANLRDALLPQLISGELDVSREPALGGSNQK